MTKLILLLVITQWVFIGCKQGVEFGSAENTEASHSIPPIPVEPEQPSAQGPMVKIIQAPSDHRPGQGTHVVFEVLPGDNEIAEVQCFVNSFEIPCDWVKGVVKLFDIPLGKHWFEVVATDVEGLVGKAKEKWSVLHNYAKNVDDLIVDKSSNKTDILFVIDNSSSMRYEQSQISKRFSNFINQVDDLDWHIGITTTDGRKNKAWSDGRLHPFSNGDSFLTTALEKQKAQELFSHHVKRRERGSDNERGIHTTYRSVERALRNSTKEDNELAKFFRRDAALAVVVVSDEDDSGSGQSSEGDNLISLIEDNWGSQKIFQFNSIIVHTRKCASGKGDTMGVRYERLSKKTNGLVGDVCADNYSQMLTDLGKGVANLTRVHKLKCKPEDVNSDGKVDLKILPLNGKKLPGYSIDRDTITFDRALKTGHYKFVYFCLEE